MERVAIAPRENADQIVAQLGLTFSNENVDETTPDFKDQFQYWTETHYYRLHPLVAQKWRHKSCIKCASKQWIM